MKKLSVVILIVLFAMVSSTAWAGGDRYRSNWGSSSRSYFYGGSHHYSGGNNHYNNGWGRGQCRNGGYYNPFFYSGLGYVAGIATGAIVSGIFSPQPAVVYAEQPVMVERPAVCYETYYTRDHWGNPVTVRRQTPCY